MSVTVTTTGHIPAGVWDAQASTDVASGLRDAVVARAGRGIGETGAAVRRKTDGAPSTLRVTGRMLREFRVVSVDATGARIESVGSSAAYAPSVDAARPWMGPTPQEAADLQDAATQAVVGAMVRS